MAVGFDGVPGLFGVEGWVGAEVDEGGEVVVDFELVGARFVADDALISAAVREPIVQGDGAGGGDEDEIAGGKDGAEGFVIEDAEAELGVAVFAEEVGDAA